MTQGPRDIFHGFSCLLASLSGGQSKSLALLQGKMASANVPFQQIPRFIELKEDVIPSPDSVEPVKAISPTDLSYELEYYQSMPDSPNTQFVKSRLEELNDSNHDTWNPAQKSLPFVAESEAHEHLDLGTLNIPRLGNPTTSWSSHMTQV